MVGARDLEGFVRRRALAKDGLDGTKGIIVDEWRVGLKVGLLAAEVKGRREGEDGDGVGRGGGEDGGRLQDLGRHWERLCVREYAR